jgi:hypothetical protein
MVHGRSSRRRAGRAHDGAGEVRRPIPRAARMSGQSSQGSDVGGAPGGDDAMQYRWRPSSGRRGRREVDGEPVGSTKFLESTASESRGNILAPLQSNALKTERFHEPNPSLDCAHNLNRCQPHTLRNVTQYDKCRRCISNKREVMQENQDLWLFCAATLYENNMNQFRKGDAIPRKGRCH